MILTQDDLTIYSAIRTAAIAGKVCPSNADLGALIGLTGNQISILMNRLNEAGYIVSTVTGGTRVIRVPGANNATTALSKPDVESHRDRVKAGRRYARDTEKDAEMGCNMLHSRTLHLYERIARERKIGVKTAALYCQFGQDYVDKARAA